jgi:putative ABC transport system ATP-binding protein
MTPASGLTTVIELRDVRKAFPAPAGERVVLDAVDLAVERGEVVAVAGRSGSGKTTLLTIVAGLEAADAGAVAVLGRTAGQREIAWRELAMLPQSLGLLDELTIAENIALPLRLDTVEGAAEPLDVMTALGVDHLADRFPSETSLGEQQRAALARAMVVRPLVLLADEPISHQNDAWARTMMTVLQDLAEWGTTCLLATHNEIAFGAAGRVLELRDGRLHVLVDRGAERTGW